MKIVSDQSPLVLTVKGLTYDRFPLGVVCAGFDSLTVEGTIRFDSLDEASEVLTGPRWVWVWEALNLAAQIEEARDRAELRELCAWLDSRRG